ncbi:hypothetical protein DH2020_024481 [Rehmannia glutinosa]|uniref:FAD-dependent oxidoreductase domain-containing protein 1 n=1 Tax=Rehmannia glutinosa TaxID=99300 RepID=A0ABR0W282_REHGL
MAASVLKIAINSNRNPNGVTPPRRFAYSSGTVEIATFSNNSKRIPLFSCPSSNHYVRTRENMFQPARIAGSDRVSGSDAHTFDVVIVGAGIIGLTIARQFLLESNLSVAVVDAAIPCAGATGAGSMLVGRTAEDCSVLRKKVEQLVEAGLGAEFLSCDDLLAEEPALELGEECGAAFMPDDCQLDARRAVAFIEKANRSFAAEGRYAEFYYEPVTSFLRSDSSGGIEAIKTSKNTLHIKKVVVIAAGCWSGSLMHDLIRNAEIKLNLPVKPRKGHLLVLENFKALNLNHGLMEVGYVNHESAVASSTISDSRTGFDARSSRQLVGFSTEIDESIIARIWERASEFFPILKQVSLGDLSKSREVRVGLRPYLPGGKPAIGPVPGLSKAFLAAGHEGEGLSLTLLCELSCHPSVESNLRRISLKASILLLGQGLTGYIELVWISSFYNESKFLKFIS